VPGSDCLSKHRKQSLPCGFSARLSARLKRPALLIPFKKTTFSLPSDLYKQLKIEAAKRDTEMSTIVADALRKHLSEDEHEQ
jgi:hypothetical protein